MGTVTRQIRRVSPKTGLAEDESPAWLRPRDGNGSFVGWVRCARPVKYDGSNPTFTLGWV
jgi:hypothetical protein